MPAAITLTFDTDAAARIEALWRALADGGLAASMLRLGYVPHLTMLVLPDADGSDLAPLLAQGAALVPARIVFGPLGVVPTDPAVLWLSVVPATPLLALHTRFAERITAPIHPHYRPGAWMPHVTLADDLQRARIGEAIACIADLDAGAGAVITAIEAVRFPPVEVTRRLALG